MGSVTGLLDWYDTCKEQKRKNGVVWLYGESMHLELSVYV